MERVIKILMLEDTPEDALLIKRTLKQSELTFDIKVVSNEKEYAEALDSFSPELVLSDHQLPQFTSTEALALCRKKLPFCPFILVTGAVSEEFAASIIKAGADDYLLKSNLKRLNTAISQAIDKKRTQESLQKSEANLRTIFNTTETAFVLVDLDFNMLSFNRLFAQFSLKLMGFVPKEGDSIFSVTKQERQENFRKLLTNVINGETIEYENEFEPGKGPWYHYQISPVRDSNNVVISVMASINDITPKKKAEEAKRQTDLELQEAHEMLLFHIENTPLGFIEWDPDYQIKSWSKRCEEIFGWTERELIRDKVAGFKLLYEEDHARLEVISRQMATGEMTRSQVQTRNYRKDGRVIWCEWFNSAIKDKSGKVITIMSLVQEITERKNIENVLREYNDRFEILSKATNDAIWDWDIIHDSHIWNHGIETIFGYTEREVASTKNWWQDKIHPYDYARVLREIKEVFDTKGANWSSLYKYRCADGTYKHVLDRAYVIYQNEKPVRMIGAMQDITENIRTSEEIARLSLVASHTQNSVLITDADGQLVWFNEAFTRLSGFTLTEVAGKKPGSFLQGPESDPVTVARISRKLKNKETFSDEIINYSKSGRKYWLRLDVSPVFDSKGVLTNFISVQNDISQQKEFENQLTTIARELTNLIQNASVPIFGLDRNGYLNEWNKVAQDLSGYSKNDVLGKKWVNFLDPKTKNTVEDILLKAYKGEPSNNVELPFLAKEGKEKILLISVSPRLSIDNEINGLICVGQDITEVITYRQGLENIVKERTRELHEALQKEKELVEMKGKFVSIASHEFRTPLSTISFAAESIRNYFHQLSAADIQKKLIKIEDQASHMTNLLEDILTIGKSEAGKIKVKRVSLELKEFIASLIDEVRSTKQQREVVFNYTSALSKVNADDKLLRNVIVNLLTNAIKFSPPAEAVTISVYDHGENVVLEVQDKGIGIAEEELQSIFEPFQRASNASAVQGTGLGLSILKKAVELMGGSIIVTSQINKGSTFKVEMPMQ